MSSNDVSHATDWLSTPLSDLAAVEAAFRCQVCKDFYNTPMITSCSHTFCSLCIRRALSSDGKCPMCRTPEQELKLRSNWSMEEAVEAFAKARPKALCLMRDFTKLTASSPKRKAESEASPGSNAPEPKRLRSSSRLSGKNRSYNESGPAQCEAEWAHTDGAIDSVAGEPKVFEKDEDYIPEPAGGLVPCPACQRRMKEWQVFSHLESCPGPEAVLEEKMEISGGTSEPLQFTQSQRVQNKSLERLPALSYSLLKDHTLRKKLVELGISGSGSRQMLEKRHKEWITLWNANCDSIRPKKRSELIQDLEKWEKAHATSTVFGKAFNAGPAVKDKDFDGAAWASKHDASFRDLIASARKSKEAVAEKQDEELKDENARIAEDHPTEPLVNQNSASRNLQGGTSDESSARNWPAKKDPVDEAYATASRKAPSEVPLTIPLHGHSSHATHDWDDRSLTPDGKT